MAKPGDTRKSPTGAMQIWTGRAWVPVPRLKAQQQAQRKQIAEANARGTWVQEWWKAATSGPERRPANAERSWKSRGAMSGTVSSAVAKANKPSSSSASTAGTYTKSYDVKKTSKPPKDDKKKNDKPASTGGRSSSSSASKPSASKPSSSSKPSAMGGGRKPSVSQSNTEWVKKGTIVNGKEVKKGYLAQKGKPERRVTANVRMVKGNAAGYKAGSTAQYKAGRRAKKK